MAALYRNQNEGSRDMAPQQLPQRSKSEFMDSISSTQQMDNPVAQPGQRSERSEDEAIRASRQQRMEEQGLSGGRQRSGWRAVDRSGWDEGDSSFRGRSESEPMSRADGPGDGSGHLQALLSSRKGAATAADPGLTAEQFTLCALTLPSFLPLSTLENDVMRCHDLRCFTSKAMQVRL
jgi:hypothetical protein